MRELTVNELVNVLNNELLSVVPEAAENNPAKVLKSEAFSAKPEVVPSEILKIAK